VACPLPFISPAVKPVIAATLRRFSTSVLISIRAPHSVTKATIPNQIATPRANAVCPAIPDRSNTKDMPAFFPKILYKARARIEQAGGKLKRFKRIALRCEKTAQNYGSFVALALGFILIKSIHTA
jgi:transposase